MQRKIGFSIVVLTSLFLLFLGVFVLYDNVGKRIGKGDDFFKRVAKVYFNDSFSGIVVKKYIDSSQHNFKKVVVKNALNKTREIRFDYEWPALFSFIKEGDSLSKEVGTLDMRLKRAQLDTLIRLNFSNIIDSGNYHDFLHRLDSVYQY